MSTQQSSPNGTIVSDTRPTRTGADGTELPGLRLYEGVQRALTTIKHEINNPLAIISGNAQLLLELAQVMDLDDEVVRSIKDIEEASQRVAASLDKLGDLPELLASHAGANGRGANGAHPANGANGHSPAKNA